MLRLSGLRCPPAPAGPPAQLRHDGHAHHDGATSIPGPACSRNSSMWICSRCWSWCATPSGATTPSASPAPRSSTRTRAIPAMPIARTISPRRCSPSASQPQRGWPCINLFYNTGIGAANAIFLDDPWSRPGDYVLFRATTDLVCASTACPDDIDATNAWNPTDIHVRVYPARNEFSRAIAYRMTPDSEAKLTRETPFHPQDLRADAQFHRISRLLAARPSSTTTARSTSTTPAAKGWSRPTSRPCASSRCWGPMPRR